MGHQVWRQSEACKHAPESLVPRGVQDTNAVLTPRNHRGGVQGAYFSDQLGVFRRHDLTAIYGYDDIAAVLRDVNVDLIFILFPLTIAPIGEVDDIHRQWAAIDYKVEMQHLPKGLVMFDTVQIVFSE